MTISGTMPANACDVFWCACIFRHSCVCKLHHIVI